MFCVHIKTLGQCAHIIFIANNLKSVMHKSVFTDVMLSSNMAVGLRLTWI